MPGKTKIRVDQLLVDRGYFPSRAQAQSAILAGTVRVGRDYVVRKAAEPWDPSTEFAIVAVPAYASRGALKLKPALDRYGQGVPGAIAMDIGASTGGFTDLLLQRGAAKVYAVDVGFGQLHWRLRQDPRVICLERTNARYLTRKQIPEPIAVLTVDVSFISAKKVLAPAAALLAPSAWVFVLIKPQFEAHRREVQKGGVVRDAVVIERIVAEMTDFCRATLGWRPIELLPAAPNGPRGNQEYVGVFQAAAGDSPAPTEVI